MAYEKHNWVNGEVIDADKLNRIEKGIADADASSIDTSAFAIKADYEDTVHLTEQTLTNEQKLQARTNIDVPSQARLYEVATSLSNGLTSLQNNTVHLNDAQTLTEAQKTQARDNIGAITASEAPVQSVNGQTGAVIISGSGNSNLEVGSASGSIRGIDSPPESSSYTMGKNAVALGTSTARGENSFAVGSGASASGYSSHAEGGGAQAQGQYSHAEGSGTVASGKYSHSEGGGTTASGDSSHAEGSSTKALRVNAHAEGASTIADNDNAHAEGTSTTASGYSSHAEGSNTKATASQAHAEGVYTEATGGNAHAEGAYSAAWGEDSHAEGDHTVAKNKSQHVFGEYNAMDPLSATGSRGTYVEIVGNGTSSSRSNARTLDWSGNETLAGKLTVGAQATADNDVPTLAQVRALIQEYLNNNN